MRRGPLGFGVVWVGAALLVEPLTGEGHRSRSNRTKAYESGAASASRTRTVRLRQIPQLGGGRCRSQRLGAKAALPASWEGRRLPEVGRQFRDPSKRIEAPLTLLRPCTIDVR